jgi:hypothetical protein
MNKGLFAVLGVILVLAVAGGSFYGGMVYGKSQAQADLSARRAVFQNDGAAAQGQGAFAGRGQRNGQGNFVLGTIKQIGDGSLVLTDNNGKETQVKVTDTTMIQKNASVKLADLTEGETVMVSGSAAADGSVTARSVQVTSGSGFGIIGAPGGPAAQGTPGQ